jgi:hypothetical protein
MKVSNQKLVVFAYLISKNQISKKTDMTWVHFFTNVKLLRRFFSTKNEDLRTYPDFREIFYI